DECPASPAHFCKSSRDSGGAGNEKQKKRWCGRGDSNPHGLATVSPSSWCVCQFRHFRTWRASFLCRPARGKAHFTAWPAFPSPWIIPYFFAGDGDFGAGADLPGAVSRIEPEEWRVAPTA